MSRHGRFIGGDWAEPSRSHALRGFGVVISTGGGSWRVSGGYPEESAAPLAAPPDWGSGARGTAVAAETGRNRHHRSKSLSWVVTDAMTAVTTHQRKRMLSSGAGDARSLPGSWRGPGFAAAGRAVCGHAAGPRRGLRLRRGCRLPRCARCLPSLRSSSGLGRGWRPAPTAFNRAGGRTGDRGGLPRVGRGVMLPPTILRARPPCPPGRMVFGVPVIRGAGGNLLVRRPQAVRGPAGRRRRPRGPSRRRARS